MKSSNVETGKNTTVFNYLFYSTTNYFMNTVQNIKFQSFQHRRAETPAHNHLPSSTYD